MPHTFEELTRLPERELARLWRAGTAPAPEAIAGHVFRGRNTARTARLGPGGGAFAKGFMGADGCNFPVSVHGDAWRIDTERPFGFFHVGPTVHEGTGAALLLDYGRGRARTFRERGARDPGVALRLVEQVARALRDVLVQPGEAADGVLLGRAFFTGTLRVPITYFVLERWQPLVAGWAGSDVPGERPRRRAS